MWSTYRGRPLVAPAVIERRVYACIARQAVELGCTVFAIGGMPDHVHLSAELPAKVSPAKLMQRVKGASSAFAREHLITPGEMFGWQDGYGVFSVSRSHRQRVISYIRNQQRHNEEGTLWREWEAMDSRG